MLLRIVRANAASEFGREHGFAAIRSTESFRRQVPLCDYESFRPSIERMANGEPGVLTTAPVDRFVPTSGTTSAARLIPYTSALLRDFDRAIAPWIVSLFASDPQLAAGGAYWSVSPLLDSPRATSAGIPIGFTTDDEYLGAVQRRLVRAVQVVPSSVAHLSNLDAFRYATLLHLVARRDLRLISVWNPTFLSLIVEQLPSCGERLMRDLTSRRAHELSAALRMEPADRHRMLWPDLRVISCWTAGAAAKEAMRLASLFPHARIQPKGLISTEGIVSIPVDDGDAVLAIRSHAFEFLDCASGEELSPEDAVAGRRYEVVLTTSGGLYRYRTGDSIEITGHLATAPRLRFIGRSRSWSDRFGEKLNEDHVAAALQRVLGGNARFAMLACEERSYVLYLETSQPDEWVLAAGAALDRELEANPNYALCRRLGQLGPLRTYVVAGSGAEQYLAGCVSRGQRLGDVKSVALHRGSEWYRAFHGRWLQ